MLSSVFTPVRAGLVSLLIVLNTITFATPLLLLAVLKALLPFPAWRRGLSRCLIVLAESWIGVNGFLMHRLSATRIHVEGLQDVVRDSWYLVLCNHQSWVDIPVLQQVFNRRIPFLKFFLKRQLIWVPVLGLVWWALDFPFMRRYSRAELERHPEWRGRDLEVTRRACARFRELPVSVMNYVEGTRFTPHKHARQQSPYAHLLLPRAGGSAFVLGAMGEILQAVIDVTIVYPQGRPDVYDLVSGRVREVRVHVQRLPIPHDLLGGDYENDAAFRERFQSWINQRWAEKDARIAQMLAAATASPHSADA